MPLAYEMLFSYHTETPIHPDVLSENIMPPDLTFGGLGHKNS
jgi:hypothetical protein